VRLMAADNAPPEGFEQLFNGKDLTNFKASEAQKKQWVIKEGGVLEFNPTGKKGEMTLWTEKEYGDVTLSIDWRWVGPAQKMQRPYLDPATGDEKKDANGKAMTEEVLEYDSGVYVRGNSKSQINMWNWPGGSGEVYGYRTDRSQPVAVRAGVTPKKKMDKPIGEWNHMVITMKGDRLTVELNGEEVISNAQLPKVPEKGALALQDHGQGFQLKNIYVKELK
ncbi:MAG TPA: DUF1080 domain-containing protein, partial [Tepidisphaeraceae bacterium]|nr:DUF1080 domain-containing protein [Tepidisphaeraceae bacterium]